MGRAPIMVWVWKWKCRVILQSRKWEAKQLEEYRSYIPVPALEVNWENMANSLSSPSLSSLLWLHTFPQHLWAWHRAPEKEGETVERLQKSTEACSRYNRHKVLIQRDTWEDRGVRGQHVMAPVWSPPAAAMQPSPQSTSALLRWVLSFSISPDLLPLKSCYSLVPTWQSFLPWCCVLHVFMLWCCLSCFSSQVSSFGVYHTFLIIFWSGTINSSHWQSFGSGRVCFIYFWASWNQLWPAQGRPDLLPQRPGMTFSQSATFASGIIPALVCPILKQIKRFS